MEDGEVFARYHDAVYGFLLKLCHNADLSEELTQETFYQAVRQWGRYRGEAGVLTWLCAIAKRLYVNAARRPRDLPLEKAGDIPDRADVAQAVSDSDLAMSVQKALHHLPDPYREVFTLKVLGELSHAQIAEICEKTESWSRVTYYRARMMLLEAIEEEKKDD